MEDAFTQILGKLSKALELDLKPDDNQSCLIDIQGKLSIQLELDPSDLDQLVLGAYLGELTPGKFREEVLLSALKANALAFPRMGHFAYSERLNQLILFETFSLKHVSIDYIVSVLLPFIQKAYSWKEAVAQSSNLNHLIHQDYVSLTTSKTLFEL